MNTVKHYACYDYNDEWHLIEMLLEVATDEIDWFAFEVPEEGVKPSDWQAPYLEQYLNEDGTEKICDTYDEPEDSVSPARVAFFIFKTSANELRTPYGSFLLEASEPLPQRLAEIIEFDCD